MALAGVLSRLGTALLVAGATTTIAPPSGPAEDPVPPQSEGLGDRKGPAVDGDGKDDCPMLAMLDQVHTGEHVMLDADSPTQERFDALLSDRSTGDAHPLDPRLLGLLRTLAERHPGSRIELVSGYRSWKLNEMLRKKGHHVASHSQHSLGHACDFRIVLPGAEVGIDPRVLEAEIRKLGWEGGVGVYPTKGDWFVHADVGRKRGWVN
ncbi:MAG: YcbK family protein [Polyangiaceae bacterium]